MLDKSVITDKRAKLDAIRAELKTEFFGMDSIIDRVIDSVSAWYIFPEIITRPVIVNLWGMTGVGKTQLVRRLSHLLGYAEKFVEVVMDGSSKHGYAGSSIASILSGSKIDEGQPGILLLDEMQRFRTRTDAGDEVKVERYQDVWTLLSDGKFSSDSSVFGDLEMALAYHDVKERDAENDSEKASGSTSILNRGPILTAWQARDLKRALRLPHSVRDMIRMPPGELTALLQDSMNRDSWEIDYSKLLIFISGNLDSAFKGSDSAEDSDSDADFYHELTKNISVNTIKSHLGLRFKPEQIARFGNNHIMYPSLSRKSYELLIARSVAKYVDEMAEVSGIKFGVSQALLDRIYANSVYPTQGTRPVFSSIHKIFSTLLVDATFWAIENGIKRANISITEDHKVFVISGRKRHFFHVEFDMDREKKKRDQDFTSMVAAHEAGHAVVYSRLFGAAPFEVKINVASFKGGYMMPSTDNPTLTKQSVLDEICVLVSGRAAEELIFGAANTCSGAESDISRATSYAALYTRRWGFDTALARVEVPGVNKNEAVLDAAESDARIKEILAKEYERAKTLLIRDRDFYSAVVRALLSKGTLDQEEFKELAAPFIELSNKVRVHGYTEQLNSFLAG